MPMTGSGLECLPIELLMNILVHCDGKTLVQLECTCRRFAAHVDRSSERARAGSVKSTTNFSLCEYAASFAWCSKHGRSKVTQSRALFCALGNKSWKQQLVRAHLNTAALFKPLDPPSTPSTAKRACSSTNPQHTSLAEPLLHKARLVLAVGPAVLASTSRHGAAGAGAGAAAAAAVKLACTEGEGTRKSTKKGKEIGLTQLRAPRCPAFDCFGKLRLCEYDGRCVVQLAIDPTTTDAGGERGSTRTLDAGEGRGSTRTLAVVQRIEIDQTCCAGTAAGVAPSPDGSELAVSVHPHATADAAAPTHGVHIYCASTGRLLRRFDCTPLAGFPSNVFL
jgi:hypothetical protein